MARPAGGALAALQQPLRHVQRRHVGGGDDGADGEEQGGEESDDGEYSDSFEDD